MMKKQAIWKKEESESFHLFLKHFILFWSRVDEQCCDRFRWTAKELRPTCVCAQSLSSVWLSATPWTVARQAPLSMKFSGQEYWSRLPCPPPGDLPDTWVEAGSPESPEFQIDSLLLSHQRSPALHTNVSKLLSHPGCHIALSRVPCARQ